MEDKLKISKRKLKELEADLTRQFNDMQNNLKRESENNQTKFDQVRSKLLEENDELNEELRTLKFNFESLK
jgi:hypothetical protein